MVEQHGSGRQHAYGTRPREGNGVCQALSGYGWHRHSLGDDPYIDGFGRGHGDFSAAGCPGHRQRRTDELTWDVMRELAVAIPDRRTDPGDRDPPQAAGPNLRPLTPETNDSAVIHGET